MHNQINLLLYQFYCFYLTFSVIITNKVNTRSKVRYIQLCLQAISCQNKYKSYLQGLKC